MSNGKILVIRGGAIGDFVVTLPVFAALRRNFPEVGLSVVGYPRMAELARLGGLVGDIRSIESRALAGYFARGGKLDEDWGAFFAGFNVIFSYLYDPEEQFRANLRRVTRAQVIQGVHRPDEQSDQHATSQLLKALEALAIFDADAVPRLSAPAGGLPNHGPWVAIHPGSGSERKNWPEESWASLIDRLRALDGVNLLLVGGEAEGDRLKRLATRMPAERVRLCQNEPLTQVAAALAGCDFFLGHDSGISHIASAVGLPGLLLWGLTKVETWGPQRGEMRVLHARDWLPMLEVDAVWNAFIEGWNSRAIITKTL